MWDKKHTQPSNNVNRSTSRSKNGVNQTPRNKQRAVVPLPSQQRKSMTPSRMNERVASSPLKVPLEKAIQSCFRSREGEKGGRSRVLGKSTRREADSSSSIIRRGLFEDDEIESNKRAHTQTINFLKKHFDFDSPIDSQVFIDKLVHEFQDLWGNQNVDQILDNFTDKVYQMFGAQVDPRYLIGITRQDGMIGLILQLFKSINQCQHPRGSTYLTFTNQPNVMSINKSFEEQLSECANLQHIKNIMQEFMELMYKEMQGEIYGKFNVQMKRMVLKYREAEKIMKKVQEKLVHHADYFQVQEKCKKIVKGLELQLQEMTKQIDKASEEIKRQREITSQLKLSKSKLEQQSNKLKYNLQKFQTMLMSKFQSLPCSETQLAMCPSMASLSRKASCNVLMDRTKQFSNMAYPQQPFQIKIDTQFIQRQNAPPLTQTTTRFMQPTFYGNNSQINNGYSPIKLHGDMLDSCRPSYEGGIRPGTKIGEFTYSPYQSRINRHF